jgi:hypothetical protein
MARMMERPIFQVTLASGQIVTSSEGFVDVIPGAQVSEIIFSEDGRLLTLEAERTRHLAAEQARASA